MKKRGYKRGSNVKKIALKFLKLPWQDDTNAHDYEIFTIPHMETFYAQKVENWNNAFESSRVHTTKSPQFFFQILILFSTFQEEFIRILRSRYAAMILQTELNRVWDEVYQAAIKDFTKPRAISPTKD